jgi:hypothetical protein
MAVKAVRWWLRKADSEINYKGWINRKRGFILNVRRTLLSTIKADAFTDDTWDAHFQYCRFAASELGTDLVVDGDFAQPTGWTLGGDAAVASDVLTLDTGTASQDIALEENSLYQLTFDINKVTDPFELAISLDGVDITRKFRNGVMSATFKNTTATTATLLIEGTGAGLELEEIKLQKVS